MKTMTLEEIIKSRRSVRSFTKKPVPKEAILKMLDMARWAPYASECWRFIVVEEEKKKEELSQVAQQSWIATAPVIIVVGADLESFCEHASFKLYYRWDAYKFREIFYIQDTAAAIQNLMLTAVNMGLGTCWIGSFNEGYVSKAVAFPPMVRPVAMIPVGYPAKRQEKGTRKPLEEITFWETYRTSRR